MLRLQSAAGIVLILAACGSNDDGGSGGGSGTGGSAANDGGAGTSGSTGAGGSAGQSGSSGRGGAAGSSAGTGGSSGGASGRGGSGGVSGRVCGGIAGLTCDDGEWCDFDDHCGEGDMQGVCKPKPGACTKDCPGVCGCDGMRYCNACEAETRGIDVSPTASCSDAGTSGACTSDDQCAKGLKCCYPCGIPDCENRCITPDPNGQCPLFP